MIASRAEWVVTEEEETIENVFAQVVNLCEWALLKGKVVQESGREAASVTTPSRLLYLGLQCVDTGLWFVRYTKQNASLGSVPDLGDP
jgi:hypothetical protein